MSDAWRERVATILEIIARDRLPNPHDLDVALDAIECETTDEIERLREEKDEWIGRYQAELDDNHRMIAWYEEVCAERDALRVALMPFALAAPLDLTPEMDDQYVDSSSDMFYDLTYGYFRKARIALGKDR